MNNGRQTPPPVPNHDCARVNVSRPTPPPVPNHNDIRMNIDRPTPPPVPDHNKNILELLKRIGVGKHCFASNKKIPNGIPNHNGEKRKISFTEIETNWYDLGGLSYKYNCEEKSLSISVNNVSDLTILGYLTMLPSLSLKIKLNVPSTDLLNIFLRELSKISINNEVILEAYNISYVNFDGEYIEPQVLPDNVKVSVWNSECNNTLIEEIAMNLSDSDFDELLSILTPESKRRLSQLRLIAFDFYNSCPDEIKYSSDIKVKSDYIFNYIDKKIEYDWSAVGPDLRLRSDCNYAMDPLVTFNNKKGVCLGRSKLFKILSNNCYMNVPCYIITGITDFKKKLSHGWNEVFINDNTSIVYDASHIKDKKNISEDLKDLDNHIDAICSKKIENNLFKKNDDNLALKKKRFNDR